MTQTNFYKQIKEKIFDLLSDEFDGHELRIYKEDNPAKHGYHEDSVSIDMGEQALRHRWSGVFVDEYPCELVLRRQVVDDEKGDTELSEYVERIKERLVQKNRNIQSGTPPLWFDSKIESVDPVDEEFFSEDEDANEADMDLVHKVIIHWAGYIAYEKAT
jgi:hypothetical protein